MKYKVLRKIDWGAIYLPVSAEDLEALKPILETNTFEQPNLKLSIYKNRRGRWKGVYLWCKADLGCCRIRPMFCTSYDYTIQTIEDLKIITEEPSAF